MVVMSSNAIDEQAQHGASKQRVRLLLDVALASRLAAMPPSEREKLNEEDQWRVAQSKARMLQVLTQEVSSSDMRWVRNMFDSNRLLVSEVAVDMKCHDAKLARADWKIRRPYKWFLFTDCLLVCRPSLTSGGWHKKELWPLSQLSVSMRNCTCLNLDDEIQSRGSSSSDASSGRSRSSSNGSQGVRKVDKREVLRLSLDGTAYKCWAQTEGDMLKLVETIDSLRSALEQRQEYLLKRWGHEELGGAARAQPSKGSLQTCQVRAVSVQ